MVHLSNINKEIKMSKNYKNVDYWGMKPEIVKIFDDLESFLDHCRFEMLPYNEADLYNRESFAWRSFEKTRRPKKPFTGERKPYQGKRHNGEHFSR